MATHSSEYTEPNEAVIARLQRELTALQSEVEGLRRDAALGRFIRPRVREQSTRWRIEETFIDGAPSLETLDDVIETMEAGK